MSSNHTLVARDEWDAMQERITNANAYVLSQKEEARRIKELAAQRKREAAAIHSANQEIIRHSVASLRESFRDNVARLGSNIDSRLRSQGASFDSRLDELSNSVRITSNRISTLNQQIEDVASTYNDFFQAYLANESDRGKRAEATLNEVDRLLSLIETLSPQRFASAEYSRLISSRQSIRTAIDIGDSQVATVVAQNGVLNATRLLAHLQVMNEQYNMLFEEVSERALVLQETIDNLSSKSGMLSFELNGAIQEFDYDISFWSNGKFDSLVSEFNRLLAQLRNGNCTLDQLSRLGETIEVLRRRIENCDMTARKDRAGAIAATDTILRLHNGLTNSNWNICESGYDTDERGPYKMNYTDASGNVVSIVVYPDSPQVPGIIMEVFSENDELAAITKDGIHDTLEEEGMSVGQRAQRNDCRFNPTPNTFMSNAVEEARQRMAQQKY